MVAWFLIAIATLAIFGYIAVSGVQNMATTSDGVGRIETVRRMDAAVNGLIARMAPAAGNSIMYLPAGQDNGAGLGYGLPADLAGQGQTPFGQKFVYCPFGDTGVGGNAVNITNANNSTYMVRTATYNGKTYVVGNRAYASLSVNPNIMGWILAPRSKLSPVPSCDQVTYNASTLKFEVPDGLVKVISRDAGIDEARTVSSRTLTYYVSPTGTGSGASSGDAASLATAMGVFQSRMPPKMTIIMATGSYAASATLFNLTSDASVSELRLTAQQAGSNNVDIDLASSGFVRTPGTLILDRINFDVDATIMVDTGRVVRMINSQTGRLIVTGGSASLVGANSFIGGTSYNIQVTNGGFLDLGSSTVNMASTAGYGMYSRSSTIRGENATVNFLAGAAGYTYGVFADDSGTFGCQSCAINFNVAVNNWGVMSQGNVTLRGSTVSTNVASPGALLGMYNGGRLQLQSAVIGTGSARTNWTVRDLGGGTISGSASTIYRGTSGCWTGNVFSESLSANGSSSQVQADVAVPGMASDPPTKAEVQAYSSAMATNARRSPFRQINASDWTCTP